MWRSRIVEDIILGTWIASSCVLAMTEWLFSMTEKNDLGETLGFLFCLTPGWYCIPWSGHGFCLLDFGEKKDIIKKVKNIKYKVF
jgi:hypothetical protein